MRVHLRINYGCDKRFFITKDTLRLCHPYFDTIKVLVTSTDSDYQMMKALEAEYPKLKVTKMAIPYYGDYESMLRNLSWDVPEDEWIHMLDSDERPTYQFLTGLQGMIADAIANGVNVCRIPSITHYMKSDVFCDVNYKNTFAGKISYCEPSLFKYNRHKNTFVSSYGGCHSMPRRTDGVEKLYLLPTLHIKQSTNWKQALILQAFFNPMVHSPKAEREALKQSTEYAAFEALKNETKCYDSSHFLERLEQDPEFKQKFRDLFLTMKDSKFPVFSFAYRWVVEEDFKPMVFEKQEPCGKACCNYGDIQL